MIVFIVSCSFCFFPFVLPVVTIREPIRVENGCPLLITPELFLVAFCVLLYNDGGNSCLVKAKGLQQLAFVFFLFFFQSV